MNTTAISATEIFTHGHTAYNFTDEPVTDAELKEVYDLAKLAPTLMNSQPLRVVYVRTAEGKARLLPHVSGGNQAKAESAPVVAILAADIDFHEHLPRLAPFNPGAKDNFAGNAEGRTQVAINNTWMQAGYFIMALRALGLDAGPMGGIDRAGIDKEFFAGTSLRTVMLINIGHVSETGNFPRQSRFEADEVLQWA